MKSNIKIIRKKRVYSESFKRKLVEDFERGRYSVPQLEKLHNVSNRSIYNWIYKYSQYNEQGSRVVEMSESSTSKVKALQQKVKELERMVGQKQIEIDYLQKMMDIARDELKIDIKKNYDTLQSGGSGKTRKK